MAAGQARGDGLPSLESLREIFDASSEKYLADQDKALQLYPEKYYKALSQLIDQARETGRLRELAELKAEEDRFIEDQSVPEESFEDKPTRRSSVKAEFRKAAENVAQKTRQRQMTLAQQYLKKLHGVRQGHTRNENLSEGFKDESGNETYSGASCGA
ncbi:MAG: hypothetical protein AAF514_18820 [Verrucomicrobiota bacterium]